MRWLRLLIFAATAPWTVAAPFVWNGAGGDGVLTNPANWVGGAAPANDGTAVLIFGDTGAGAVRVTSSLNVSEIRFQTTDVAAYTFNAGANAVITLQNGLQGSANGGSIVFGPRVTFNVAQPQAFAIGAGIIEIDGGIVGSGKVTKTGPGELKLAGTSSWSGGFTQTAGQVYVTGASSLGTGTLNLGGGELNFTSHQDQVLTNAVVLSAPTAITGTQGHLAVFTGAVTLGSSATLTTSGASAFFFTGPVNETGGAQRLVVTGLTPVILVGDSNYTGGTQVDNGSIIFATAQAVPTVGKIDGSSLGYVGIAFTDNVQSTILDRLNGANFRGMIGFDTAPGLIGHFDSNIDLTNVPNYASIGSHSTAVLDGQVKVANGSDYRFGGGGGTIYLEGSPLTARGNNLQVVSPFGQPLTLVLRSNNTYTGDTNVLYSVLVLDRAGTLPSKSALNLVGPGYVGYTENASFSPASFLGRLGKISSADAIVGIDSSTTSGNRVVSDAIDLSMGGTRTGPYYLGTSTRVTLTGTLTPTVGDALYLTAVKGGYLTVASQLGSNIPALVVGQTNSFDPKGGTVELTRANTYQGGTEVRGGVLRVSDSNALGLGGVVVNGGGTLDVSRGVSIANSLTFNSGGRLSGSGIISSPGGVTIGTGAILSPAGLHAVGSLSFTTGLTLTGGGVLEFDVRTLGAAAPGWDTFNVTGGPLAITADGSSPFNINVYSLGNDGTPGLLGAFDPTQSYSWQFATATSLTGFSSNAFAINSSNFLNGTANGSFFVTQNGNALMINFTPVPEPSTYALFAFGLAILGVAELRRRRRK